MPNYILCTFCTVHLKIVHVTGTTLSFKLDAKFLGDLSCFWTCGTGWWAGCTGTLARPWLHRHRHCFTHLRLTFLPHPVANSHHVPNVWLQRKGGSQKLDPPPLFKGGGGSGSPESQPSPKSLNFLLILYFSRSFLEHVSCVLLHSCGVIAATEGLPPLQGIYTGIRGARINKKRKNLPPLLIFQKRGEGSLSDFLRLP